MSQQQTCAGSGRAPLTAFAPFRCPVCEAHVYITGKGTVASHRLPRWHALHTG